MENVGSIPTIWFYHPREIKMTYGSKLEARVAAVNAANAYGNQLFDTLAPIFAPLVGEKADRSIGGFLQKIAKQLPELPNNNDLTVYRSTTSRYSLVFHVKANTHYHGSSGLNSVSYIACVYIAHTASDSTIESIYEPPGFRTDYNINEIETNRRLYKEAKQKADEVLRKLEHFGENDIGF